MSTRSRWHVGNWPSFLAEPVLTVQSRHLETNSVKQWHTLVRIRSVEFVFLTKLMVAKLIQDNFAFCVFTILLLYKGCTLQNVHFFIFSLFLFDRSLNMFPVSPFTVSIQIFSNLLSYGNSCVNPILYAFLSEPFRRGFCAVVSCIRPAGPHGLHG